MDTIQFEPYHSSPYSDSSSAPRTPSPDDIHYPAHPYKHHDVDGLVPNLIFHSDSHHDDNAPVVVPESSPAYWQQHANRAGSLLHELYNTTDHHQPPYEDASYPPSADNWDMSHSRSGGVHHLPRRATFPSVRYDARDRDEVVHPSPYPPYMNDPNPANQLIHPFASPRSGFFNNQHQHPHMASPPSAYLSPPSSNVKLEDHHSSMMVPSQQGFYRSSPSGYHPHHHHLPPHTTLSPHTGLPIQHTDDAASKETQYLRRRCFNCHTTEPPSWRRSTLNPGKIVCNKCGLYERTHLRPRPLRFDELRAGNKARKQSIGGAKPAGIVKAAKPGSSPTSVKKEPGEHGMASRRASVSSSSGTNSDWDDSVSVYSSGSAPSTSFNSPAITAYPIPRSSLSPSAEGMGIRLPNAPLNDISGISPADNGSSASSPGICSSPDQQQQLHDHYYRRDSVPELRVNMDVQVTS